jgi:hypothetical protein
MWELRKLGFKSVLSMPLIDRSGWAWAASGSGNSGKPVRNIPTTRTRQYATLYLLEPLKY